MAKSSNNLIALMLSFLIIEMAMASSATGTGREASAPAPKLGEMEEFVSECAKKLGDRCGEEIFGGIFWKENERIITKDCCESLMGMGRECHDALVEVIVSVPDYAHNKSITVPKSVEVWNKCAHAHSPAAYSPITAW